MPFLLSQPILARLCLCLLGFPLSLRSLVSLFPCSVNIPPLNASARWLDVLVPRGALRPTRAAALLTPLALLGISCSLIFATCTAEPSYLISLKNLYNSLFFRAPPCFPNSLNKELPKPRSRSFSFDSVGRILLL